MFILNTMPSLTNTYSKFEIDISIPCLIVKSYNTHHLASNKARLLLFSLLQDNFKRYLKFLENYKLEIYILQRHFNFYKTDSHLSFYVRLCNLPIFNYVPTLIWSRAIMAVITRDFDNLLYPYFTNCLLVRALLVCTSSNIHFKYNDGCHYTCYPLTVPCLESYKICVSNYSTWLLYTTFNKYKYLYVSILFTFNFYLNSKTAKLQTTA